jgi:hypothetical protein
VDTAPREKIATVRKRADVPSRALAMCDTRILRMSAGM